MSNFLHQDIFDEVDTEKMGDIYQRELIVYLKELHGGKFANLKVYRPPNQISKILALILMDFKCERLSLFQLQVFMNNLEDDGDKILDFENFLVRRKYENILRCEENMRTLQTSILERAKNEKKQT